MKIRLLQDTIDIVRGKKTPVFWQRWKASQNLKQYNGVLDNIRNRIRKGERIKVFFFISSTTVNFIWERLYQKFKADETFTPIVVVCPFSYASKDYMISTTRSCTARLKEAGYNVLCGYDFEKEQYIDINREISNDICFFNMPYDDRCDKRFYVRNFMNCLTFYTPYSYMLANTYTAAQMDIHECVYKIFPETSLHIDLCRKEALLKGKNVADFLGYIYVESLLELTSPSYEWKGHRPGMKKVILAPHHLVGLGNILMFHQFFLDIAEKYKDRISFVFKPHPILKETLLREWEEERINGYYAAWDKMDNTKLETGGYEDLFWTSDAVIGDSVSFIAEYTLLGKPLFFIEKPVPHQFNAVGTEILNVQYKGKTEQDIIDFIENVVLGEHDEKKSIRSAFAQNCLRPSSPDASLNVYNYVRKTVTS